MAHGSGMDSIVNKSLGLAVLFILLAVIVIPFFNTTYNITILGLSSSVSQGLLLIVFVIALVGFARGFLSKY